jgi:hypothetical protein
MSPAFLSAETVARATVSADKTRSGARKRHNRVADALGHRCKALTIAEEAGAAGLLTSPRARRRRRRAR